MAVDPFMSRDDFRVLADRIFDECRGLIGAGQAEYAGGENALGNFVRGANEIGSTPEQVLWIYAMKHKDGIASYIRGHVSQREPVEGRINDLIVYLLLFRAIKAARERGV